MNFTYCQGITNISISPPSPTKNDSIIISVFQTYNSSACWEINVAGGLAISSMEFHLLFDTITKKPTSWWAF
jgi:hypothetical protein